ncbi:channel protein, hemolysin III family [Candidatus Koribacter versatilis Ellin345]|uniref:Channel protein, hemolysin III family n=1 Tax=Koribacter versatilis (strain Ellin345) TaxID=204669 RepID=Q1ITP3_KORVE|nr:hemolysin III family protein [Candidatus Koribacter versatilis]ABF39757.1 channel protein, hemolysin III family [Candidatus Koribacter versatilis Ellin345]
MRHIEIEPFKLGEAIANSVTHGIGALLSVLGLITLIVFAAVGGNTRLLVSVTIYGATLCALYLISTLYHAIPAPSARRVFRFLDHASIYLLIAGTYTPFTLALLRGGWGWTLFALVWAIAILGVVYKIFATGRHEIFSSALYIGMGWIVVIAIKPLLAVLPMPGFLWMMAGGIFYTGGIVFYLKDRRPYFHMLWHLCVLAGSVCHFVAILRYVVGPATAA